MILGPLPLLPHLIKTLNSGWQFSYAADQLTCSVPSPPLSFVESHRGQSRTKEPPEPKPGCQLEQPLVVPRAESAALRGRLRRLAGCPLAVPAWAARPFRCSPPPHPHPPGPQPSPLTPSALCNEVPPVAVSRSLYLTPAEHFLHLGRVSFLLLNSNHKLLHYQLLPIYLPNNSCKKRDYLRITYNILMIHMTSLSSFVILLIP